MSKLLYYIIFFAAGTFFISCTGSKYATQSSTTPNETAFELKRKHMAQLVDFAGKQLNAPYKWGGNTPKGFDCSGFTSYCYNHFGVQLPRTAADQSLTGKKIHSKKAKAGDLIFFKGPNPKKSKVGHVGIVVSGRRKNIKFIHAANTGIIVSHLNEDYFSQRFKTIRRIRK